jgi:ferritin-like metal-binding protein YciE
MHLESLKDLYIDQLQDLYSAEQQLESALPKMMEAASHPELKTALRIHLDETKTHRERLEQVLSTLAGTASGREGGMRGAMEEVYKALGRSPAGKKCEAMVGLIQEGQEMIKAGGDADVRDAGMIAAAQRVEHYEIAAYGTVCTYAELLGRAADKDTLGRTLVEEKATDEKLNQIAKQVVNLDAAAHASTSAAARPGQPIA